MDNLSPAARASLDALAELGHGNVHEVREKSGKARSTTDKALKELADAGLISEVDTGADPAEGTPTRWQLTSPTADVPTGDADQQTDIDPAAGIEEALPEPDHNDAPDGANGTVVADAENDNDAATGTDTQTDDTEDSDPAKVPARPTRPADRKVLIVAGVLGDYPDGATIDVIADACGLGVATVARLLTAMTQADAARRIPADPEAGTAEMWKTGEGKASQVDPNPAPERCPTCHQIIRSAREGATATGTSYAGTRQVNSDGSEPFKRGDLEQLVEDFINDHPGRRFSPQDIANELTARHGREISSGAVRNNCTKLAAAGKAQLASESPLTFTANPTPPTDENPQ